ncbi:MAG: DUF4249 domain-containing protein [Runella sp.]
MKYWLIIIFVGILTSCDGTFVFYGIPFEGEKLVVNALLGANQPVKIYVGKTWQLEGKIPDKTSVDNATVLLYENDVLVAQLSYFGQGIYQTSFKSKTSASYHCKVQVQGFKEVSTQKTTVPESFPFGGYELNKDGYIALNGGNREPSNVLIKLTPDRPKNHYYFVKLSAIYQNKELSGSPMTLDFNMEKQDDCFFTRRVELGSAFFYSNHCFGIKSSLIMAIETIEFGGVGENRKATEIVVNMRNISKEYFEFMRANREPVDIERAFTEPAPTFTNINGGYGLWASYNETTLIIPL